MKLTFGVCQAEEKRLLKVRKELASAMGELKSLDRSHKNLELQHALAGSTVMKKEEKSFSQREREETPSDIFV